jgi:RNA polymerase sigma-70 factor (ECF subfamily)
MSASCPVEAGEPAAGPAERGGIDALIGRVKLRDERAALEMVEQLHPMIAPVVHANLPRRDEPADLMQEIYLKIFSRLEQFRGEMPFAHWARRIALNTCLDRLRRQHARPELRWSDLTLDEQAVIENSAAEQEPESGDTAGALSLIEKLLAQMPAGDAWLLRQIEIEGRTIADICAETGWNSGLTRVRTFRARRRLQAEFRKLEKAL